jgi:hypothetical protein
VYMGEKPKFWRHMSLHLQVWRASQEEKQQNLAARWFQPDLEYEGDASPEHGTFSNNKVLQIRKSDYWTRALCYRSRSRQDQNISGGVYFRKTTNGHKILQCQWSANGRKDMPVHDCVAESVQWRSSGTNYRRSGVLFWMGQIFLTSSLHWEEFWGPASLPLIRTASHSLKVEWLGREDFNIHILPILIMRGAIHPLHHTSSWHDRYVINHRDNF